MPGSIYYQATSENPIHAYCSGRVNMPHLIDLNLIPHCLVSFYVPWFIELPPFHSSSLTFQLKLTPHWDPLKDSDMDPLIESLEREGVGEDLGVLEWLSAAPWTAIWANLRSLSLSWSCKASVFFFSAVNAVFSISSCCSRLSRSLFTSEISSANDVFKASIWMLSLERKEFVLLSREGA